MHRYSRYQYRPNRNVQVEQDHREDYEEAVWNMYAQTYAKIGMHLRGPHELYDYDLWEIELDNTDTPRAFRLYKITRFGRKAGLSGSDGSEFGRRAAKAALQTVYHEEGTYGEVSHRVADIVLAAESPVVCADHAQAVLGKPVKIEDAIRYTRSLGDLGPVTKVLVGRPLGVPTTTATNPQCGIRANRRYRLNTLPETDTDDVDIDAHLSCLLVD